VGNLRKAIAAYGEALRFRTPDVAPLDYARTQNNLGVAYRCLSEHEDPVGNLRKAIEAFGEALRFRM
jgi:tetratricopeptide (TPR) repeat protein